MRIVLVTPYGRDHRNGNWHTAARWARFLRDAGHAVRVQVTWDGRPADLMLALHARRSYAAIRAFTEAHPERPLLLTLTGPDLYRDIRVDAQAQDALERAHRIVVLQERGLDELSPAQAAKTRVIYQSAPDIARRPASAKHFETLVIGHLREEKDPFRAALATLHLPPASRIRVTHLGRALDAAMTGEAARLQAALRRWRWAGEVPHGQVLGRLARARLMVISSRMEGGANVICEALAAGVPVLASHMPGNLGMLGEDYPGYFPLGDERQLAVLLDRAETDAGFYDALLSRGRERRERMRPEREAAALQQAVATLAR